MYSTVYITVYSTVYSTLYITLYRTVYIGMWGCPATTWVVTSHPVRTKLFILLLISLLAAVAAAQHIGNFPAGGLNQNCFWADPKITPQISLSFFCSPHTRLHQYITKFFILTPPLALKLAVPPPIDAVFCLICTTTFLVARKLLCHVAVD